MVWTWRSSKAGWDLKFFQSGEWQVIEERFNALEKAGKTINPERKNLFKALEATPYDKVRVVIIGQDPYPNPKHATGIAFDCPPDVLELPPTLRNIYHELQCDLGYLPPRSGQLLKWCSAGVLLLNAVPSCTAFQSASHRWVEWEYFTKEVVEKCDARNIPFVLLGNVARSYNKYIFSSPVVETSHPSPLGANRGFFGSRIFSKVNQILVDRGEQPIDWRLECETPANTTMVSPSPVVTLDTTGSVITTAGSTSTSIPLNSQRA